MVPGQPEDWIHSHPSTAALVVEVSVASLPLDRKKSGIYAEAGVPEYWLVRAEERLIDVYRQPSPGGYLARITLAETEMLACSTIPEIQFQSSEIFPARSGN